MLTKRMSEAEIEEALRAAALTRKVEGTTGGVKIGSSGASVEVEAVVFTTAETADACKAWLLAPPRRLVAMGAIKFALIGGEWTATCDVEPKARKARAGKA